MLNDLRYGIRVLLMSPGFTAVAVLTLALGIGANTAVFSLVSTVLIRKLPFNSPDQVMVLWGTNPKRGWDMSVVSPANFADWKDQNHLFDQMAAWEGRFYTLAGVDEPEQVWSHRVSEDFFSLLGVNPALGRQFLPEDYQRNRE